MDIEIGIIINTHGIKGHLKVDPLTDYVERFKDLDYVYVGETKKKYKVEDLKFSKGYPMVKLEGIDSIDDGNKLRRDYMYVDYEDRVKLPKDVYFIFDIVGCKVYDMEGNYIGQVKEVLTYAANDVYLVEGEEDYMIPAIKEFVKEVNIEEKLIKIDPIEGMI